MEVTIDQAIGMLRAEEAKLNDLNRRIAEANALLSELETAKVTLKNLPDDDTETLVPIGGGVFLPVISSKNTKVLLSIGAGVSVEKDIPSVIEFLENRSNELKKSLSKLIDQANKTQANVAMLRDKINQVISAGRSNKTVG